MNKHVDRLLNLQNLYFEAWRAYAKMGFDLWQSAFDGLWKVYHPLPHRRHEDSHEKPPCVTTNAAHLTHHYGRRCHDVDVEHI